MTYQELEKAVEQWAEEKGILDRATPLAQGHKTLEEALELAEAVRVDDRAEIADALGDILVTIIIQAKMQGMGLTECLQGAYNIIAKRKGAMVNGTFVKEA
ncbi:MAG: MazG nucleotide pyrophosphohydrolase domain-containing protein [Acidiferrobacterales bacterium]|nr:MazG nucleotide pyrophosphohydrolase domain-containing protein [Acidiferrobacterales bacterium]